MRFILDENTLVSKKYILNEDTVLPVPKNPAEWEKFDWAAAFEKTDRELTGEGSSTDPNKMTTEELWNKYFETVWKKDADKVKKLGAAFQEELIQLGFNMEANPFCGYVTWLLKSGVNQSIFGDKYKGIHNAYLKRFIDRPDLVDPDSSDSLVGWPALYNLGSATEIYDYLESTSEATLDPLIKKALALTGAANINATKLKFLILTPIAGKLTSDGVTSENLTTDLKALDSIDTSKKPTSFRPKSDIEAIFQLLGKTTEAKKVPVTASAVSTIWESDLRKVLTDATAISKFLVFLTIKANGKAETVANKIKEFYKESTVKDFLSAPVNYLEVEKFNKALKGFDLSDSSIIAMAEGLSKLEAVQKIIKP